jgi:hypothetical protein
MKERGASPHEVVETVLTGQSRETGQGRTRFRRNFVYNSAWRGTRYATKQVEAIAVRENSDWVVITVLVRFF